MARKPKNTQPTFSPLNPHAAGIDIGAASHFVAVPPDCTGSPVLI
ncbi:hypothetical protein [Methylovulum sp.]|nr:hypothetical protein [Methylovulum sp.]MDD5125390.1 hypothetical protein [Methylovulum sp.]